MERWNALCIRQCPEPRHGGYSRREPLYARYIVVVSLSEGPGDESQARWLSEWLKKMTGLEVRAQPIVTMPGWMVKEQKLGRVRVLNHNGVSAAVVGRNAVVLSDEDIDLLSRQVEELCRDVED